MLQLLVVEGVQRHQFFDGTYHCERISAGFIVLFQVGARVFHLHHEGRLAVDPAFDLDATQTLRDELHAASVSRGIQQPHRAADGGDVLGAYRVQILRFDEEQTHHFVFGLGHPLDGLTPHLGIGHHRLDLRRHERPRSHRHQVENVRERLLRDRQACVRGRVG